MYHLKRRFMKHDRCDRKRSPGGLHVFLPGKKKKLKTGVLSFKYKRMVGATGFEPATSTSRT